MFHFHRLDPSCAKARASHKCSSPALPRPQLRTCKRRPVLSGAVSSKHEYATVSAGERILLGVTGAAAALLLSSAAPAAAAEPFLVATGARGPLVEQEQALYKLRVEKEDEARGGIQQQRDIMEAEARTTQGGKLCATPFGIDVVGVTIFVALIGAGVGGYTARQRKEEVERLNEQLRKINAQLRKQARAGTAAAAAAASPAQSYTSTSTSGSNASSNGNGRSFPQAPLTATVTLPKPVLTTATPAAAAAAAAPATVITLMSMDEDEMSHEQLECRDTLRAGKKLLKSGKGAAAQTNFETALVLSRRLGDKVQERRATRGLAAAAKMQKEFPNAISHYERVLQISKEMGEYTGDADAYGSIADCYTEMDQFDRAAEYYDLYIQHMED